MNPPNLISDIGAPMLLVVWPAAWILLVPVIAIEWAVLRKAIAAPDKKVLWAVALSNAVTALLGVPLAWFLMFGIELLSRPRPGRVPVLDATLGAAWMPEEKGIMGYWYLVALLVLYIPLWAISSAGETAVNRRLLKGCDQGRVRSATWRANAWSYAFMLASFFVYATVMGAWRN